MQTLWLLYGCLAVLVSSAFANLAVLRWRERVWMARLRLEIENIQGPIGKEISSIRSQLAAIPPPSHPLPESSHRRDSGSAILDLHHQGESVTQIAAILGLRCADVKLTVLVHDLMFPSA
jgi:hypothetical protein